MTNPCSVCMPKVRASKTIKKYLINPVSTLMCVASLVFTSNAFAIDEDDFLHGLDLKTALSKSSDIFVGRVVEAKSFWSQGVIVTQAKVESIEAFKGASQNETVTITTIGGTVGDIKLSSQHLPSIEENEVAVFFVRDASGKSPLMTDTKVFSLENGKIRLRSQSTSSEQLKHDVRMQNTISTLKTKIK